MDKSANSVQPNAFPRLKKVPLMSLLFNSGGVLHDGIQNLENAQKLLDELKGRLDPSVQSDFEDRLHDLHKMAENQHKKDGALPRSIYIYLLNPKRFKTASRDYYNALKVSSMLTINETKKETRKCIEDADDPLFIDGLEAGTWTARLAGEVGEAEFHQYHTDCVYTHGVDIQVLLDAINHNLMQDAADPDAGIHTQTSLRVGALVLE